MLSCTVRRWLVPFIFNFEWRVMLQWRSSLKYWSYAHQIFSACCRTLPLGRYKWGTSGLLFSVMQIKRRNNACPVCIQLQLEVWLIKSLSHCDTCWHVVLMDSRLSILAVSCRTCMLHTTASSVTCVMCCVVWACFYLLKMHLVCSSGSTAMIWNCPTTTLSSYSTSLP